MFDPDSLISLATVEAHVGQIVDVVGWVASRRTAGGLLFLELRGDGGRVLQVVVVKGDVSAEAYERARAASRESAIAVKARVTADGRAPSGYELQAIDVEVLGEAPEWPLSRGSISRARRIDERHIYLRSDRMRAMLRLRAAFSRAAREWLQQEHFVAVDAPIFTPNVVEERATLFETSRFQSMAYLSQSGQLYNEAAAAALGRVYSFGPTFRSEPTPTNRHLAEFWMIEPELSGTDLEGMIGCAESLVRSVVTTVARDCRVELTQLGREAEDFAALSEPFERVRYVDAVKQAQTLGVSIRVGEDLCYEAERAITLDRRTPLFVTHYPRAVKPFYMRADPDDPRFALCADLLAPEGYGEVLGGGERERDHDVLEDNIERAGIPVENYRWYLDLRTYGSMPHSGFGMGLERMLMWIAGLEDIDETIAFPRTPNRSAP